MARTTVGPHAWPFDVGELIASRDNYGPMISDLSMRAKHEPHAQYVVVAVGDGGRWLLLADPYNLKDDYGRDKFYGGSFGGYGRPVPGVGASYFRIVGECGLHHAGYSSDLGMFVCLRCDTPLPEHVSHYWMRQAGWRRKEEQQHGD